MTVINQEEHDAKLREAADAVKVKLSAASDVEIAHLLSFSQFQLSLVAEEHAKRMGIPVPHITVLVTDAPIIEPVPVQPEDSN